MLMLSEIQCIAYSKNRKDTLLAMISSNICDYFCFKLQMQSQVDGLPSNGHTQTKLRQRKPEQNK